MNDPELIERGQRRMRRRVLMVLLVTPIALLAGAGLAIWQPAASTGPSRAQAHKTASSDAPPPLPVLCCSALTAQRAGQLRWINSAGEAWHNHGLIVTTKYGEPIDPRNFHRAFKARSARAGVTEITVYSARHTCASLLVAMNVHPRVAIQILRHSQIAVTTNVYGELSSDDAREALCRLGERLSGRHREQLLLYCAAVRHAERPLPVPGRGL